MRAPVVFAFLPFLVFGVRAYADNTVGVYFRLESFTYSETVPIAAAVHEWDTTDFDAGDQQWSWNWLEAGVQWGRFTLGYLWREEYDLRFSPDTAELYWRSANKLDLPVNAAYLIDLDASHFQADGFRIAFHDQRSVGPLTMDYQLGFAGLDARDLIDGTLHGHAQTLADNDYEYAAELNYHYSEDRLFERVVEEPDGAGYAIDFALQLHYQQHRLALSVSDLYGYIDWERAPYTEGTIDSDNRSYDASGYVRINPTLSGYEGITEDFRQDLEARYTGSYEFQWSATVAVGVMYLQQYDETLLGPSVALSKHHKFRLGYWPEIEMLQLQWQTRGWTVSIGADGIDEGVRALSLLLSYQPQTFSPH